MTDPKGQIFRFGEFEIQERGFRLVRGGETIPVEPKAFRVLLFLLRNPHRLVTKDELLDAVWQETSVSENSLTRSIALLRRLLGDDTREPRFIATVPTVGYRFLADVSISEKGAGPAVATVESVSRQPRGTRSRNLTLGLIASSIVLLGVVLVVVISHGRKLRSPHATDGTDAAPAAMRSVVLVSVTGYLRDPVLSPDGKEIAYVWNGEGVASDVYVQLVRGEKAYQRPLRLTQTKGGFTCCTSWSPDQAEIAFGHCDDKGGGVFIVPALGGPARKVADVTCVFGEAGWPIWTGDGKSLILLDQCAENTPHGIVLLSLSSGEKQCLHRPTDGEIGDLQPALSPDQNTLAFIRFSTVGFAEIDTLQLNGDRKAHPVVSEGNTIGGLMWAADGRHIVFVSSRRGLAGVWRVPAAGGTVDRERVYPAVGSLSRDGRRLVYVQNAGSWPTTIVRAELGAAGGQVPRATNLVSSASETDSPQLSPDGKQMAYGVAPAGNSWWGGQIWKSKADGSDPTQLTSLRGYAGTPRWSPDGRSIAFDYRPGPHGQIFVMDAEGRSQRALAANDFDQVVPSWSRDGTAIYFCSNRTGRYEVWKKNLATGLEVQVTHHGGFAPSESYDGSTLYYTRFDGAGIWSIPVQGGDGRRLTDAPHLGYWGYFAVTDKGIYLLDSEYTAGPTILFYRFQTHELTPVMTLTQNPLPWAANLSASRDGRTVLFAQYKITSSITMAEDFQ
jgi:Tol biopolymer transport system component/DNA-binding winged helix-turn-helix (wHTH) protein